MKLHTVLLFSLTKKKCGANGDKIFKKEESVEVFKILCLIKDVND